MVSSASREAKSKAYLEKRSTKCEVSGGELLVLGEVDSGEPIFLDEVSSRELFVLDEVDSGGLFVLDEVFADLLWRGEQKIEPSG